MVTIKQGDAVTELKKLPSGSVHTCITSPPYYGLRDYNTARWEGGDPACDHKQGRPGAGRADGIVDERCQRNRDGVGALTRRFCAKCGARRIDSQIGLEETPDEYVAKLVEVFREVKRVLRNDGTLWIVLGDSYARQAGDDSKKITDSGMKTGRTGKSEILFKRGNNVPPPGLKPKDLMGIPWMVAFALRNDGWYLRSDIIWAKPNPMPEPAQDRCVKSHEYVFLLAKSAKYFYDAEAVKEPCSEDMRRRAARGYTRGAGGKVDVSRQDADTLRGEQVKVIDVSNGRNKRDVWTVSTQSYKGAHFATFPTKLIEPCILAGCSEKVCAGCGAPWVRVVEKGEPLPEPINRNPLKRLEPGQAGNVDAGNMGFRASKLSGQEINRWKKEHPDRTVGFRPTCGCGIGTVAGTVLDPFAGSGTTGEVAEAHGRNSILIELNQEYVKLAEQRTSSGASKKVCEAPGQDIGEGTRVGEGSNAEAIMGHSEGAEKS